MSSAEKILELVGGEKITQTPVKHAHDLIKLVREGLPTQTVDILLDQKRLTLTELDRIIMPRKTFYHRRKIGHLTAEQSDRLLRVVRILALAEETFGDRDKAHVWLRRPTRTLRDEKPLELLDTEEGARQVEILLGRIAHGIAA